MQKSALLTIVAGSLLLGSGIAQANVSGDLLTNETTTPAWQNCDGSDLIDESVTGYDPTHLSNAGCVYRETPAIAGEEYKMTCGVSSFKYSSITLAFLNDNGDTLATETTEIFEDIQGAAYSVELTAPEGTTVAAVGVYGLAGSGFQDCTLFLADPVETPVDGSISGLAWFDKSDDGVRNNQEVTIPGTPVEVLLNGNVIEKTDTNVKGAFYFGELDLGQCYQVKFGIPDPALTYSAAGAHNVIETADGLSGEYCLTAESPNVIKVRGGFTTAPVVLPPSDHAVCGSTYLFAEGEDLTHLSDIEVTLENIESGDTTTSTTNTNGGYAFQDLAAGSYKLSFVSPAGHEFVSQGTELTNEGTFAGTDGKTRQFTIPQESNTDASAACTLRWANAWIQETPVALERTVAKVDKITATVGETVDIDFLANDTPCEGEISEAVIVGHNVPGNVRYESDQKRISISGTTEAGTFGIKYGIRGTCGSYDQARIKVKLKAPKTPAAGTPAAPSFCYVSIGKANSANANRHIDIYTEAGQSADDFATAYNMYDSDDALVYQVSTSDAYGPRSQGNRWWIYYLRNQHGIDAINVASLAAVENGLESEKTQCERRNVTPIAIDLNQDGMIEPMVGSFDFDIDGDGVSDQLSQWFQPTDGILINKNFGDAIDGNALFGDVGGQYQHGFEKLELLDTNQNGSLENAELAGLAIWTDLNSNAFVDSDEVHTLESFKITSISVDHYKLTSRVTLENGNTLIMKDLWLSMRPMQQASK
jgi:hypothetical protein